MVLAKKFNTLYTHGNLNNHIGVPLTLLRLTRETEIAVIEMGANHQREIDLLCRIAEPTHGYICSIGKAHIEGFGGIEGVKKGKGELYDYLLQNNGMIFINMSSPHLKEILGERQGNIFRYGQPDTEINGEILTEQPFVSGNIFYKENTYRINSRLIGAYNFGNILNTFVLGVHFGVSEMDIIHAIETYTPENNRSEVRKIEDYELIMDAYNANPTSMSNAIDYFNKRPEKTKVLIVGDMFELGEDSRVEHQKIINQMEVDRLSPERDHRLRVRLACEVIIALPCQGDRQNESVDRIPTRTKRHCFYDSIASVQAPDRRYASARYLL